MRTLYRASRIRTFGHPAIGEWLLADDRHVERVGAGEPPAADRVVDLPGATIVPGFLDAHVHLTGTGIHEAGPPLDRARSSEELVALVRETVLREGSSEEPFLAHGFDESTWARRELPSLTALDGVSGRPLVLVRADGHISLASSAALERSAALAAEGVERDDAGVPTGVVRQQANDTVQRWFYDTMSPGRIEELQLAAAALAASRGVTSVQEMALVDRRGPRDFEVLMNHGDRLPLTVVPYVATSNIPFVVDFGLPRIGGDFSIDGSIGARTACLSEPYSDGDGSGVSYFGLDELCEFFHNAHLARLQVSVHAIGDAAIDQALRAWERVFSALDSRGRRHFRASRNRIEHFEMPASRHVERAAVLGLSVSVQPSFDAAWGFPGGLYELRLGEERASRMNPFRNLIDRGLTLGGGSDSPITPLDPMAGVAAAEMHHDPRQRLSREEALRLFTVGAATVANLEGKKGKLEPGMHADFAAFEVDPVTAGSLANARPVLTVSVGREVYAA